MLEILKVRDLLVPLSGICKFLFRADSHSHANTTAAMAARRGTGSDPRASISTTFGRCRLGLWSFQRL